MAINNFEKVCWKRLKFSPTNTVAIRGCHKPSYQKKSLSLYCECNWATNCMNEHTNLRIIVDNCLIWIITSKSSQDRMQLSCKPAQSSSAQVMRADVKLFDMLNQALIKSKLESGDGSYESTIKAKSNSLISIQNKALGFSTWAFWGSLKVSCICG